jgi:uncharacterized DUF497 family protein
MLKITGIIWLEDIVQKLIWKHQIEREEVVEILNNNPSFRYVEKGFRKDENVYAALGQTDGGRYLIVFFIYKSNHQALIISARDMTDSERRKYEQK